MNNFLINCSINNKNCDLIVSLRKLSIINGYNIYKNGCWIGTIRKMDGGQYQLISYLLLISQAEVDAIGRSIEQKLSLTKTVILDDSLVLNANRF